MRFSGRRRGSREVAASARTGKTYQAGIGPHSEDASSRLAILGARNAADDGLGHVEFEVPYPALARAKCDVCIGEPIEWAIEIKMLRLMGDIGKPNDNMLMHILSPYAAHRSALTDCAKLTKSGFQGRKGILIFGYDYDGWPMDPAIDAFEVLASAKTTLSERTVAAFEGLIHPVHQRGRVFAWELDAS